MTETRTLSQRVADTRINTLIGQGNFGSIENLAKLSDKELLARPNFGMKAVKRLRERTRVG